MDADRIEGVARELAGALEQMGVHVVREYQRMEIATVIITGIALVGTVIVTARCLAAIGRDIRGESPVAGDPDALWMARITGAIIGGTASLVLFGVFINSVRGACAPAYHCLRALLGSQGSQ